MTAVQVDLGRLHCNFFLSCAPARDKLALWKGAAQPSHYGSVYMAHCISRWWGFNRLAGPTLKESYCLRAESGAIPPLVMKTNGVNEALNLMESLVILSFLFSCWRYR